MIIQCPHCGEPVAVKGFGRRPLDIPLKNICDALRGHSRVKAAANELNCSPAYIFKVLKVNGLKLRDVLNSQAKSTSDSAIRY